MPDVLRAHYDAIPSFHGSIPESHPARLCAIARLLGLPAAPPDGCRVLELGCATGLNLLPMAEQLPGSQFVGVDLSPVQIGAAQALREAGGLRNVELVCADLRDWEPADASFDYVIAHGVYSWVPDDVKDRLLALCARALAPDGIAYVSYNVVPAGARLAALRAVMLPEVVHAADPVARAKDILGTMTRTFAEMPGAEAVLIRETLGEMQARSPEALLHDELAPVNDPVSFRHFAAHAAQHGLHWFAEAHFASLPADHLPLPARQALAELRSDVMHTQQFLDLVGDRSFRNSLLTRGTAPDFSRPDAAVVKECAIGLRMAPADGRIVLDAGTPLQLRGQHGFSMVVEKPEQKAFFGALCAAAPERVPFATVCARANALLAQAGLGGAVDEDLMTRGILRLFTTDQVDLMHAGASDWLSAPLSSAPTPLTRFLARAGRPVVNRWHETVRLTDAERAWLAGTSEQGDATLFRRAGLLACEQT